MSARVRVTTVLRGFGAGVEQETIPLMVLAVERGALMFEAEIKRVLTGQRTGRWYKVPGTLRSSLKTRKTRRGRGRMYRASAPGEPPAVRFGQLRNAIVHEPAKLYAAAGALIVSALVGVRKGYPRAIAEKLEVGGRNSNDTRFYARPYIRPARDRVEPKIEVLWNRLLGRGGGR